MKNRVYLYFARAGNVVFAGDFIELMVSLMSFFFFLDFSPKHVKPLNPMQRALAINLSGTYYIFSLLSLPPFSPRPSGHYHLHTYLLPSLALLPILSLASSLSPAFLVSCVSIGLVILFSYLILMDYLRSSILAISDQCHRRSRRHRTYQIFPELPIYHSAI